MAATFPKHSPNNLSRTQHAVLHILSVIPDRMEVLLNAFGALHHPLSKSPSNVTSEFVASIPAKLCDEIVKRNRSEEQGNTINTPPSKLNRFTGPPSDPVLPKTPIIRDRKLLQSSLILRQSSNNHLLPPVRSIYPRRASQIRKRLRQTRRRLPDPTPISSQTRGSLLRHPIPHSNPRIRIIRPRDNRCNEINPRLGK